MLTRKGGYGGRQTLDRRKRAKQFASLASRWFRSATVAGFPPCSSPRHHNSASQVALQIPVDVVVVVAGRSAILAKGDLAFCGSKHAFVNASSVM